MAKDTTAVEYRTISLARGVADFNHYLRMIEKIATGVLAAVIIGPMVVAAFIVGLPMGLAMVGTILFFASEQS